MTYFISGHRNVSQEFFDKHYGKALEEVMECDKDYSFVVGDCGGVDTMAQEWLRDRVDHTKVTVYHMFKAPRYLGGCFKTMGGFKSDIERDSAMTKASDIDIAFIQEGRWTSGTAQNILRRYEVSD